MDLHQTILCVFWTTLLVSCGFVTTEEIRSPLVSFGELNEVVLDEYTLRTASAIKGDWRDPGGFIVGNQHSVAVVAPDLRVRILAGQENETTFVNGIGESAYFATVQDVTQINEGDDILVADYNNHCIRNVHRASQRVTTYAGVCTQRGEVTDTVKPRQARMTKPVRVLYVKEKNVLYYLLERPATILKHNLTTDDISMEYRDLETFKYPFSFVADSTTKYLYVNHLGGISRFDTEVSPWTRTVVAGTNSSVAVDDESLTNGPLLQARFYYLTGMDWLIKDQVLIVGQSLQHAMRVVNLEDDQVLTICKGETSTSPTFALGDQSTCKMNSPEAVSVIDGVIYIGELSGKEAGARPRRGHILKLLFDQPICEPPAEGNSSILYSPTQSSYFHNQNITYTCDSGYGISTNYSTRQCVRALRDGKTVYGKWDRDPPLCQLPELTSITPRGGQRAGGTTVRLTGTFLPEVSVTVEDSKNRIKPAIVVRNTSNLLVIKMPSLEKDSNDLATLHISFGNGNTAAELTETYTYRPDPSIGSRSRVGSIASGGLRMLFHGTNILSSNNYNLEILKADGGPLVTRVPCDPKPFLVECITPNISDIFSGTKVKRSTDQVDTLVLKANLLSDDVPVSGAAGFEFPVTNSFPELDDFSQKIDFSFDLRTGKTIILNGTNLNVSLSTSDYQVDLILSDNSRRLCSVRKISRTQLHCEPQRENIVIPPSQRNLKATIQVKVATLTKVVGEVAFYKSDSPATSTPAPQISPATIAVPVVIAVVVLIAAILIYVKLRKRCENNYAQPPLQISITGKGFASIEVKISANLKEKLADMYIDSLTLSFDPTSDPIGKGHFGKVYFGQLQLKGNILKTVAVKTLKETDDIDIGQLEEFLEEACFLKYYKHVNILVPMGVVWRKGGRPSVVLPYMALGDLCSLIRKPDMLFTNGDLVHFGMQIASGLEYLAENKCLHRDLAARNCLVSDSYMVKIADFGMSRDIYTENYYRESSGDKPKPVKWMALESLVEGVYNAQTEVWSFGVIIWELFTRGSVPYPGVGNSEIIQYLKSGHRLEKPTYMHPVVFEVLLRCWNADPSERPTATELREFLELCLTRDRQNQLKSQNQYATEKEEFYYSYVQNLTKHIDSDYVNTEYQEDEESAISYVGQVKPEVYETPIPILATSSSSKRISSVHGLESLTKYEPQQSNDYTTSVKSAKYQASDKDSLEVDTLGKPVPQPRITLTR